MEEFPNLVKTKFKFLVAIANRFMLGYADLKINDFLGNYFGISFYIDRKFSCKNTSFATTTSWCFCNDRIDKAFHVHGGFY